MDISYSKLIHNSITWYILHDVPGVIAIQNYNLLFAIKASKNPSYINPLLVDENVRFGGCLLDIDWGWYAPNQEGIPGGYKGWWRTGGFYNNISSIIETEFKKIKEVYFRNLNKC